MACWGHRNTGIDGVFFFFSSKTSDRHVFTSHLSCVKILPTSYMEKKKKKKKGNLLVKKYPAM